MPGSVVETSLDCRYRGQSHELRVDSVASFAGEHRLRNGYDRPDTPIEVVAIRATARLDAPLDLGGLPVPERSGGVGPTVLAEPDCTVYVAEGWTAEPDPATGAVLRRSR